MSRAGSTGRRGPCRGERQRDVVPGRRGHRGEEARRTAAGWLRASGHRRHAPEPLASAAAPADDGLARRHSAAYGVDSKLMDGTGLW